jgi:hypothetical protein
LIPKKIDCLFSIVYTTQQQQQEQEQEQEHTVTGTRTVTTMSKSQFGQFYTTNYEYILSNMVIPEGVKTIIEPFVGNGDLLNVNTR